MAAEPIPGAGDMLERFYSALVEAAGTDLEDVAGARQALIALDPRWADDRRAWGLVRQLAYHAYEVKRASQAADSLTRARAAVTYYTAMRLQDEIRRLCLRHDRERTLNGLGRRGGESSPEEQPVLLRASRVH